MEDIVVTLLSIPFCMVLTFGTMLMFHMFKRNLKLEEKTKKKWTKTNEFSWYQMNNIITCGLGGKLTQITFEHSIWTLWPQLWRQKQLKKILNSGL